VTRAANSEANSAENPFPVRAVAIRVAGWIDRLGAVWVEGQLAQINMRPDTKTVFMVLRDPAADMSLTVTCSRLVLNARLKLAEGTQVVVCGKPSFTPYAGTFSLRLSEIRAVASASCWHASIDWPAARCRQGMFDPRLKRPIRSCPSLVLDHRPGQVPQSATAQLMATRAAGGTFRGAQHRRSGPPTPWAQIVAGVGRASIATRTST